MTLNRFYVFVVVLFLLSGIVMAQDSSLTGPRMMISESNHDFGEITIGEIAEHIFVFTNTGDDTLEIANVYSG